MNKQKALPIPFLIMLLAGLAFIFSLIADRSSKATTDRGGSLQVQTVEQERMAEIYFRVLSWISDLTPRAKAAVTPQTRIAPTAQTVKVSTLASRPCRVEICVYHTTQNPLARRRQACNLN